MWGATYISYPFQKTLLVPASALSCVSVELCSSANVFSFFRLDNNWLPIRPNTKWPMAQLFKGRHRNSNMEFLNIAQIFEQCPNFFEHCSKDL